MDTLIAIGTFLAGVVARFGLVLALPVALAVLAALGLVVARIFRAARNRAAGLERVDGLFFKPDLYYAPGHLWLGRRDGVLRLGIDDLAQRLLPEPHSIELPARGRELKAGEVAAVLICGYKRVEIRCPTAGTVVGANEALAHDPTLFRRDPYSRGWLFELQPADAAWQQLPIGAAARTWLRAEASRLARFAETELGVGAADGGEFTLLMANALPGSKWDAMLAAFLAG
jgi:glycine cleavage system H lipoate-binding protein